MDIGSAAWKLDEYKLELWNKCNVGIPHLDIETNDAVILGFMVAKFISEVQKLLFPTPNHILIVNIISLEKLPIQGTETHPRS